MRWGDYVVYDNQIETIAGFSDGYVMTKSENGTVNKRKKDELFFIQKCNQCGSRVGMFSNRNSTGDLFFFMNCDECDNINNYYIYYHNCEIRTFYHTSV